MKFNNEINNILKNAGIQLNESYVIFGLDKVYDNIIKFHNAFKDKNKFDIAKIAYDTFESIEDIGEITELEDSLKHANDAIFGNIADKTCEERDIDIDYFYDNLDSLFTPMAFLKYYDEVIEYYNNLYNLLPQIEEELNIDFNNRITAKDVYDGNEEELDESVQLNEEQSQEFLLVQKIIRKITELKKCFDELSEDEDILYLASDIYDLIDELPAFDEVQHKLHNINDWFYNAIEPLVKRDYPDDNYAILNEPFNEFFQYYPKPAKMYAKMLVNYLSRLEQLFKQDYLEDDEYNGSEEELDESVVKESYEELDDDVKEIIDIVKRIDDSEMKSTLEELAEELYDAACKDDACCEIAYDFHDRLLQSALEDDDNMVYSVPDYSEVNFDNVADDFYSNLSENINTYINDYSRYTVESLMEDIIEICERYFNNNWEDDENDSETIDDEINDNIDDISTLDENVSYDETLENVREIYEKAKESFNAYSHVIYGILTSCEQCGYEELEDFASNFFSDLCSDYCNDSDNWGTEYDSDATYEKCSNIPMKQKIEWYSNTLEIKEFANNVKEKIEYIYDYDFSDDSKNSEIYDGSEDELDESINPENTSEDIEQLKFFFNKLKEDLESLSEYQKQIEGLPRKIKFDCGTLCFYIENLPEYDEYNKLKSIKDDFRREIFDTIDLENCEYTQYYDEDEELFDGDSTEAMISNLSDKAFIDEFATYYCVEKFCNNVEKELQLLNNIESYEGDDTELDESVQPKWDYKVGDEVIKKTSGKIWTISRIEPKWIFIKIFYPGSGMVGDCIYREDFPEEFEPIDKISITDTFYDGSEKELDESVKSQWNYKVGDEVLNVKTGKIWVISEIEPKWIYVKREEGVSRTIHADLIKVEDFPNEYEPVNKDDFKKYVYDGNEEELDESVSPSWHYEVGDRVVEKGGDVVWVIRYVEKYDIGLRRYAYGGVMTTSCPKDQFEEYYELLEQRDSKYMNYEGDDTELDESVNKESTPFDKMMKLHKENPDIDIRTIANKVANGNIEEYISLMKQYYEKFEN